MQDWDPALYNRFRRYRAAPVEWILQRLALQPDDVILDLGCGDGENTLELVRRVTEGHVTGLDSSPAMLARAASLYAALPAELGNRVNFVAGDFRTIEANQEYSVVFSNAALQWSRNHRDVLTRWFRALKPAGRMVVQVPANHHETAQMTLGALAGEAPWRDFIGGLETPSHSVEGPENYRAMLETIGFVGVDCYYHTFDHPMENPAAIVEFCRATALRPFLDGLPAERHAEFIEDFTQRLEDAYGTRAPLIFHFRRLFLWARRPDA
jgi:trans-aconitate 2-methyltransferase